MKPEMITLKVGDATIKLPAATVAQLALASVINQVVPPHIVAANAPVAAVSDIPALGAYWPGEGGFNGGFVPARGDVSAHYLIFADRDVGKHSWGGRGTELKGLSKTDGRTNTEILCNDDAEHPAANACAEYQADGHHDFYLPAASELYQGWLNCQGIFSTSDWYWSSSQRSACGAFDMGFEGGIQGDYGKDYECFVRPVRRKFI